jgi:ectoine hydroxylase-related dioxygenase (phytanoyl-CoA dioxygenase family)
MDEIPRFSFNHKKEAAYRYFNENGCVIFRDLIEEKYSDKIITELQSAIQYQVQKHLNSSKQDFLVANDFDRGLIELARYNDTLRERLYNVIQCFPSLYNFIAHPNFIQTAKELGMSEPIYLAPHIRMDLPNDEKFLIPPHQEIRGIRSPNMIFMITALVDTDKKKGALLVAPGSHKLGPLLPKTDNDIRYQYVDSKKYQSLYPIQQVPLHKYETMVLNMYTIHGSSPNNSLETRWSTAVRFEDFKNMPYLDGDDTLDKKFNLKGFYSKT